MGRAGQEHGCEMSPARGKAPVPRRPLAAHVGRFLGCGFLFIVVALVGLGVWRCVVRFKTAEWPHTDLIDLLPDYCFAAVSTSHHGFNDIALWFCKEDLAMLLVYAGAGCLVSAVLAFAVADWRR